MDRRGAAYFACSTNHLIDTDNGVILDVEAAGRSGWPGTDRCGPDRPGEQTFDIAPDRLIADTACGSGVMLDLLHRQRGIAPHIPVFDTSGRRDGMSERGDVTLMPAAMSSPARVARR